MREEILRIYQALYQGRENAITRRRFIARHKWHPNYKQWVLPKISDRQFRQIYSQLPIVTCDKGGFYPIRKEEILEYRDYLRKKAIPLFERWNRVRAAHPDLVGNEKQLELFEVGESHDRG